MNRKLCVDSVGWMLMFSWNVLNLSLCLFLRLVIVMLVWSDYFLWFMTDFPWSRAQTHIVLYRGITSQVWKHTHTDTAEYLLWSYDKHYCSLYGTLKDINKLCFLWMVITLRVDHPTPSPSCSWTRLTFDPGLGQCWPIRRLPGF